MGTKIASTGQASLGIRIYWAAATTAGAKPTTGYKQMPGILGFPKFGGKADSYESTTVDEDTMKTFVTGLLDSGGAQDIRYHSKEGHAEFKAILTAQATGKEIWIKILIPKPADNMYDFAVSFSPLGTPEVGINKLLENTISVTYSGYLTETTPGVVPT